MHHVLYIVKRNSKKIREGESSTPSIQNVENVYCDTSRLNTADKGQYRMSFIFVLERARHVLLHASELAHKG
jgi:hypothetical protein